MKYQYMSNGRVVSIYDYAVTLATADGHRHVIVEAETAEEAKRYAKNVVLNNEPYLESIGEVTATKTTQL